MTRRSLSLAPLVLVLFAASAQATDVYGFLNTPTIKDSAGNVLQAGRIQKINLATGGAPTVVVDGLAYPSGLGLDPAGLHHDDQHHHPVHHDDQHHHPVHNDHAPLHKRSLHPRSCPDERRLRGSGYSGSRDDEARPGCHLHRPGGDEPGEAGPEATQEGEEGAQAGRGQVGPGSEG